MDNNIRLGKSSNADQVDMQKMQAGVKKEDVGEEFASIFDKLDQNGKTKGVLEQSEIQQLQADVQEAAGNDKFSKREARKLLSKWGLSGVTVEQFFKFIQKVLGQSAKIDSSATDNDGNTTIKYNPDAEGHQVTEYKDKDGKTIRTVEVYNDDDNTVVTTEDGKTVTVTDNNGVKTTTTAAGGKTTVVTEQGGFSETSVDGVVTEGTDKYGKYTRKTESDGTYTNTYANGDVLNFDANDNIIGGKNKYGTFTRQALPDDGYKDTFGEQEFTDFQSNFTDHIEEDGYLIYDAGGKITGGKKSASAPEFTRVYNADGSYTDTEIRKNGNGEDITSIYKYDAKGQILEQNISYPDSSVDTTSYSYNGSTATAQWTYKDSDGSQLANTSEYEFDAQGTKIHTTITDEKGIQDVEHAKNGDDIVTLKDDNGNVTDTYTRVYVGGANGTSDRRTNSDGVTTYSWGVYDYRDTSTVPYMQKDADGNFTLAPQYGDSFAKTMERLGITEDKLGDDYADAVKMFKDANAKAAGRKNGGYFLVGKLEISVPKELAELLKEKGADLEQNSEIFTAPDEDIQKYKDATGK